MSPDSGSFSELLEGPPPPTASQSHQVSRFTCRARPSAQEPVANKTATPSWQCSLPGACPAAPPPPQERAGGAPRITLLNHAACAQDCLTLTFAKSDIVSAVSTLLSGVLIRKWSCRGRGSPQALGVSPPPTCFIRVWRTRTGRGGSEHTGIRGSRGTENSVGSWHCRPGQDAHPHRTQTPSAAHTGPMPGVQRRLASLCPAESTRLQMPS